MVEDKILELASKRPSEGQDKIYDRIREKDWFGITNALEGYIRSLVSF